MSWEQLRLLLWKAWADNLWLFLQNLHTYEGRPFWSNIENLDNLIELLESGKIFETIANIRDKSKRWAISFGEQLAYVINNYGTDELVA